MRAMMSVCCANRRNRFFPTSVRGAIRRNLFLWLPFLVLQCISSISFGTDVYTVRMSNVDDVATLHINGVPRYVARWGKLGVEPDWVDIGHQQGDSGVFEITQDLLPGTNVLRFVLEDLHWSGVSVSIEVKKNEVVVFEDAFSGTTNGTRIRYDRTIVVSDLCYPGLPSPDLSPKGTVEYQTPDGEFTQYLFTITNWSAFPDDLFEPAPDLPPCGLNESASRTWVYLYSEDGTYLYGFCAFYSSERLSEIHFNLPKGQTPPERVYVTLVDRRCGVTYTSNLAATSTGLAVVIMQPSAESISIKPRSVISIKARVLNPSTGGLVNDAAVTASFGNGDAGVINQNILE